MYKNKLSKQLRPSDRLVSMVTPKILWKSKKISLESHLFITYNAFVNNMSV